MSWLSAKGPKTSPPCKFIPYESAVHMPFNLGAKLRV
ncbi:hypothetical protein FOPG_12773 [Fusarium oxysporum f. sp. conglutinans race 2 54008]|uniref:Uncharacterized protein n=2 Tax=Fusarium oxysporum TaxID=5507 RepID=X0IE49_FUSOX|nr:hypothetical protein FOVG_16170 [Fusarium oxysporum f. sp. pisi HDV247]EXL71469.1 hypothetical protein FOPG_12773 [Fusarium oxysporum f. sp. conglutinans race 2 54008]